MAAGALAAVPAGASNAAIQAVEGNSTGTVEIGAFTDTDGSTLSDFVAVISWGDGTGPQAGTVTADAVDSTLFHVFGAHTYADATSLTRLIHVDIYDYDSNTLDETYTIDSTATVADAPLTPQGQTISANEGQPWSGTIAAFTDGNPNAPVSDFTAGGGSLTVCFNDLGGSVPNDCGTPNPPTATGGGGFTVPGGHTFANEGVYDVTTDVVDADGATTTVHSTVTVADADAVVTPQALGDAEGHNFTHTTVTFSDPGSVVGEFTAQVCWNDLAGALPNDCGAGDVNDLGGGNYSVSKAHTFPDQGVYGVTTTITDDGQAWPAATSTATITDAALTGLTSSTLTGLTEGAAATRTLGTFSDANPLATPADYTVSINWGDGSPASAGTVATSGSNFAVSGTHTYRDEGNYNISVLVTDDGGSTATLAPTAAVGDAAISAPSGTTFQYKLNKSVTKTLTVLTDANPYAHASDFSGTIYWGDGSNSPAAFSGTGPFNVVGTHTYTAAGVKTITISIYDAGGSHIVVTEVAKTTKN